MREEGVVEYIIAPSKRCRLLCFTRIWQRLVELLGLVGERAVARWLCD